MSVDVPEDYSLTIPRKPNSWLLQFLRPEEITQSLIGWSEASQRIIFPVYDKTNLLVLWTGRYFGDDKNIPKYYTQGARNQVIHVIDPAKDQLKDKLVIVEDIVSAIAVSRVAHSMPVFGSKMPLEHATTLSERFSEAVLWLDPDMRRASLQQALKMEPFFDSVSVVFSDFDPKYYDEKELMKFLGKHDNHVY